MQTNQPSVDLVLIGDFTEDCCGVWALPGHLPKLYRWPGETFTQFKGRCLDVLTGSGRIPAALMYLHQLPGWQPPQRATRTPQRLRTQARRIHPQPPRATAA